MTARWRGADVVARTLVTAGVKRVFALSGNHVMSVFDAALDAKLEIVHVRHEAAAVHMADAWGRLTGEPGVALVTGGPGHANAVGALYTALAAESPLVLLSGHAPLDELGRGAFQELRQADVAAPLAKASWTASSAAALAGELARALRTAKAGRPGPVHISLPTDVLEAIIAEPAARRSRHPRRRCRKPPPMRCWRSSRPRRDRSCSSGRCCCAARVTRPRGSSRRRRACRSSASKARAA
jgi:acetolactate synthase-1/2/3 large subunit